MTGHNFSVDWWTLGVLIYEMRTGRPPFMNKNHCILGRLIREGKLIFPEARHNIPMSDELKDIITKLLDKDPATRLGSNGDADEIVNHPWFAGFNWESLLKKQMEAPFTPDPNVYGNRNESLVDNILKGKTDGLKSLKDDERNDIIPADK